LCRLVVGAVFLLAGVLKISDHTGMAAAIDAYEVLPSGLIDAMAWMIPALEIAAGLMLILGLATRLAAWLVSGMLVAFLIGPIQAKIRGLNIDCGCFAPGAEPPPGGIPWLDIARDFALLGASLAVALGPRSPLALDNLIETGDQTEEEDTDGEQEA
jgi:uncharacterized membrane protein YphA (DoxX/SURF4 family)